MVEKHVLVPVTCPNTYEIALFAHDIDQFVLLEERGDRRIAFADFGPCFDGDGKRRRIVEHKAHERVPDGAVHPIGHEEVHRRQVRERYLTLAVSRHEIIPAPVVEIPHAGDVNAVAVDRCAWHHRYLRTPVTIVRRKDCHPPNRHGKKQPCEDPRHSRPACQPESPYAERQEDRSNCRAQPRPWQVGIVDRQRGPPQEQDSTNEAGAGRQPGDTP